MFNIYSNTNLFYSRIIDREELNSDRDMGSDLLIYGFFQGQELGGFYTGSVQFNGASLTSQFPERKIKRVSPQLVYGDGGRGNHFGKAESV